MATIVLHLIPHLIKGGAERQLVYMACHWARAGREVHVGYLAGTPVPDDLLSAGVHVHPIAHARNDDPLIFLRLLRLIRSVRPSIVHTWLLQMDIFGGVAALCTHTPWILREPVSELHWRSGLKARIRAWFGKRADAIVSNSAGGDAYWRRKVPQERRFIIRNAVPIAEIQSVTTPQGCPNAQTIVAAGRLDEQKNFEALIRAFARVADKFGQLVVFGEGPLRSHLEAVVEQCGMQARVRLPGLVPSIWGALKTARLFASMSRYEGNPNVVLEAMACGCPLMVSDIPAHREILDDTTALFVKRFEDPDQIAAKLLASLDGEAAQTRSRLAQGRLSTEHDVSTVCDRYDEVYETVISRRK